MSMVPGHIATILTLVLGALLVTSQFPPEGWRLAIGYAAAAGIAWFVGILVDEVVEKIAGTTDEANESA